MIKIKTAPPPAAGKNKADTGKSGQKIIIRGCGGYFNSVYDVDQLIIKIMAFKFIICLNEYETPKALRRGLNQYMRFYNEQRLHESLGYKHPVDYYYHSLAKLAS
ncbi:MAG: hypothetical protein PHQ94_08930 [Syntrophomonas sp.]|nr:hypothetical protein [Syntrophomonas sp.]